MITTSADTGDTHPAALATVNVYVPGGTEVTVRVAPVPDIVTFPGVRVRFHVPEAGRPLSSTLPVESAQVGWVMAPTTGAVGVAGWVLMITFAEATDMHPSAFVTVNV